MIKGKRNIRIIGFILFVISVCFIMLHSDLFLQKSFDIVYSDIVYATLDNKGNQIIIDCGGQRLLKVTPDNEIVFAEQKGFQGGKGLNNVFKVITDLKNHIYLLNMIKEEGGYRIKREEIVEYSPEGKYLGIVHSIDHEIPVRSKDIVGLSTYNGSLIYFIDKKDSFAVYDKENNLVSNHESKDIKYLTVSYATHPLTNDIYYSTKQGKIFKHIDGAEPQLLYDAAEYDYLSVPRDISLDQNGNLYFTDIGLRTVSMIDKEGTLSHAIFDGQVGVDTSDKYIYNYVEATNGLIAQTSDYTVIVSDGEIVINYNASYSLGTGICIVAVWVAFVVAAIVSLYLLYELIRLVIIKGTKMFKFSIGITMGAMAIAGIFILMVIPNFEDRLLDSVLKRAQAISDVVQIVLPTEEYKNLDSTSDFLSEDYIAVRESINGIFSTNNDDMNDFYCVLYTIQDNIITATFSNEEYSGAVYPYDWGYKGSDEEWIIQNHEGKEYSASSTNEGSYLFVLNPLIDQYGRAYGLVEVGTDLNSFHKETNSMIIELLLNVFAITVIIILISLEGVIFIHGRAQYLTNHNNRQEGIPVKIPHDLMRIMVFGIFFLTNMTTSFLPLYAMRISKYAASFGIPKEVLAAIPISAEVFFGALCSIFGSRIVNRLGQKKSAITGSILFSGGLVIRFIAADVWVLTLGNSIMGCGWGILLLLVNTAIASGNDEEKNKGFAGYTSAALNGINCGIVLGGFLINWLSQRTIFLVAAILSVFIFVHATVYMTQLKKVNEETEDSDTAGSINLVKFLTNKSILVFFVMIAIPVIACSYFLNYLYPILGADYGLTETRIGYSYLINGLCVMFLSSTLTEYFSKRVKKHYSLVIASLLYAVAFLCVTIFQNVYALLAVLVLLGISDSFGLPLQTSYFTDLEIVKKYGYGKSIGIYSLFENIAQAGGSFVFSYVLIIGVRQGLTIVLSIVTILAILFGIIAFVYERYNNKNTYIAGDRTN